MRLATFFKFGFAIGAAVLTVMLFLVMEEQFKPLDVTQINAPELLSVSQTNAQPSQQLLKEISATTVLVSPSYNEQDSTGQNWHITANNAAEYGHLSNKMVNLTGVTANFTSVDNTPYTLNAQQGAFNQASKTLLLTQNVTLTAPATTLTAPLFVADLATSTASGENVSLRYLLNSSMLFHLTSETFTADKSAATITFTGNVRAQLAPLSASDL